MSDEKNKQTTITGGGAASSGGGTAPAGGTQGGVKVVATDGAAEKDATAAAEGDGKSKLFVDGQPVSEEEYLAAAEQCGFDLTRFPSNYRPALSTKKHGEK